MTDSKFRINDSGTIDICLGGISLKGIYPCINEVPVMPLSTEAGRDHIRYASAAAAVSIKLREEKDCLVISSLLTGIPAEGARGIHDIEPLGAAVIEGADHVYIQGFGMEGPSGYYALDGTARRSFGLIGLCGSDTAAVIFAKDHRRYTTSFRTVRSRGMYAEKPVLSAGIDLEGTAADSAELPELYIICGKDLEECLRRAAERIAEAMRARTCMPPAFHWCSWYYHYENLTQQTVDDFLDELADDRVDFRYIQIDAGYTAHIGDWLRFNHRYPQGLKQAASDIIGAGYAAGIWISPFMIADGSEAYREHPDWVVRDPDGRPHVVFRSYTEPKIWGNTDSDYYILDMTHPGAFSYIRDVFAEYRDWGFTLFKIDFILWSMVDTSKVVRYDDTLTSVEILRNTLAMIREVIGDDGYLLASIAPFMPCLGFADGMRIAGDMGAQWTDGAYGPANLLQELPFDNYFNNIFWQNDPDSIILRDFGTHLSEEETISLALLQALSGGIITTSDPVCRLPENRRRLLDFIKPGIERVHARFPLLTDDTSEEILITHNLTDWNLLFVLNPTDHPIRICHRMDELFGTEAFFQYRFDWNGGDVSASGRCEIFSDTLAPHSSVLLFLTDEPLTEKPSNLWSRNKC